MLDGLQCSDLPSWRCMGDPWPGLPTEEVLRPCALSFICVGLPSGGLLDGLGCPAVPSSAAAAGLAAWLAGEMPWPFALSFGSDNGPGEAFLEGVLGDGTVCR